MTGSASNLQDRTVDLDRLFRLYSHELNSYAFGGLRDREAAADIVQDGFVRFLMWSRTKADRTILNSPRFFLWRIVGNLTFDQLRRQKVLGPILPLDELAETIADTGDTPYRSLEIRQQYRILKQALDEVPERHRAALLLNRVEGLSHAEIARRLGVSMSMVSKYIMSVLRHCQNRLPDQLD